MRSRTHAFPAIALSLIVASSELAHGKRILAVAPYTSYSHQVVFRAICQELHKRGHELVVATPSPLRDPALKNYTEIDLGVLHDGMKHARLADARVRKLRPYEFQEVVWSLNKMFAEGLFGHPEFKELYQGKVGRKFDAVIVEIVVGPVLAALAHVFDAPLIAVVTMDLHFFQRFQIGSPILPSHPSNWVDGMTLGTDLSFWERLVTFLQVWWHIFWWQSHFIPMQKELVERHLGDRIPDIVDLTRNSSLFLINQHPALAYARPELPNVISFSGVHTTVQPRVMSNELKAFLDNATDGFIYMSFGSTVKSCDLPREISETFLNVFARLPYRVIWKFETDDITERPDNVFIARWAPQQGILAHPNIKLFIYQGGLQSTEEAVYNAVPLIGFPFIHDQTYQIKKMISLGVAKMLDLSVGENQLYDTVREMIDDKRYKENMVKLSALVKDQPFNSMDHAAWWIEFVMRHRGAPHLQFSGTFQPWYQHYDMDVIAATAILLLVLAVLALAAVWKTSSFLFKLCTSRRRQEEKEKLQ